MFKIGDFSRLSKVSTKALRHYDEIGLLRPARVDEENGYRYYSADQMSRLNRILALKDLGFSLDQVGAVINEGLSIEQIRGMLRLKQAELQRHLTEEQSRLRRVENKLKQMEQEGTMPTYDIILKKVDPIRVACIRDVIPAYSHTGELFMKVCEFMQKHNAGFTGPGIAVFYDPEYKESNVDVEAAMPTDSTLLEDFHILIREIPGIDSVACLIHKGEYENLGESYGALMKWVDENKYRITGPNREVYLRCMDSGTPASEMITEIQFPVEKI